MHPALGQGCGDHLDSGTHYLGALLHLGLHLGLHLRLHLGLHLRLLHHHRSSDKFQVRLGI